MEFIKMKVWIIIFIDQIIWINTHVSTDFVELIYFLFKELLIYFGRENNEAQDVPSEN